MKLMKRCLSLLIAMSIMLSMVVSMALATTEDDLQVVPQDTKDEVISDSLQACGDDWKWTGEGDKIATLPHGEIYADEIYVAAITSGYWTDYKYSTTPTDTEVNFAEGAGLVTIALRVRNESAIWGGADCVFAEITPTAAAEALTEDTTVSGTFKLFYAAWGVDCNMPFSVTIKAQETPESSEGEEATPNEVISSSAQACNDDWVWTGDGDKIATLPHGEIYTNQIYVAAAASGYWTDYKYSTTPTETEVTFTEGEGLVSIALRVRQESVIWGGAECVYAEITPTAAAEALTEDTTVSGTFKLFYAAWGAYCSMPFSVTLKVKQFAQESAEILYDDRIVLDTVADSNPVIETLEVTSKNSVTGNADAAVMAYDAATNALVAVGVGKAKVTIGETTTTYTVKPAPISLFLIVGHSMGQGYGGNTAQSVANEPGQVYSTYGADLVDQLTSADGLGLGFGSATRPAGIDANTAGGGGTIGEGSGLAYSWNRLTGEKVWIVNTAHGGTTTATWQPDAADYVHTVEQMGYVQDILSREIQAGHYTYSHMGVVVHTSGNNEDTWKTSIYQEQFEAICAGFRQDLAHDFDGDNTKESVEFFALAPSWKNSIMYELDSNPFSLAKSHSFTKGRLLNYANGALADHPDTFIASTYARQWLTDAGVAAYYAQSGEQYDTNYPTQNGVALSEPTKRSNGIYGDGVHYNQLGYNTAGMHIAHNIYTYLQNPAAKSVTVYDETGLAPIEDGRKLAVGDEIRIAAIAEPVCVNNLTFAASGSMELTGLYTLKAVAPGTGTLQVKQGSTVVKTITFQVVDLPAYKKTVSTSTDYANYGGDQWNVAPKQIKLDIGTRETYSMALAGAYWANTENTGYCEEPTRLPVTFHTGEGLLEAYVTLEAGPIWGGAQCEMLKIVPTAAAYELTEATVVTGEIDIYWRGYTRIPFSIGLVPAGEENPDHGSVLPPYTETVSTSTDYATFGGSDWNVEPKTVEATIGPREKYTLALATSYWANPSVSGYSAEPTPLTATFESGDGLLEFSVRIGAGPIWGGAECELLTITPTDAAYALTEDTVVTGTIDIYWRGPVQMPFEITIKAPGSAADEPVGMEFTSTDFYWVDKPYEDAIYTFEAMIYMPEDITQRAGMLLGTSSDAKPAVIYEIAEYGIPRIDVHLEDGTTIYYSFNHTNLPANRWSHIAFVRDEAAGKIHCYVDGQVKESLNIAANDTVAARPKLAHRFGTFHYTSMDLNFKGKIASMALYSDARTAEEIAADIQTPASDGLIAHYELADYATGQADYIVDLTGNGYDIHAAWLTEAPRIDDYSYSFAVVGDTQVITADHPEYTEKIYDWILANAESKNTKFVLGLGDITNDDTDAEWTVALENIRKMDGVLPYSLIRGNHDGEAQFDKYISYDAYTKNIGGSFDGSMRNTWQELKVGDISYLIMALDFCPSDEVLAWAGDVVAKHPDHSVIVTTHAYLQQDASFVSDMQFGGFNTGEQMWEKFVSKHENIVLVISGHEPSDAVVVRQDEGAGGNVVTQMLVDPQGVDLYTTPTGMVTMLYFSEDGKHVQVETYSTIEEKWYLLANQFDFRLDTITKPAPDDDEQPGGEGERPGSVKTEVISSSTECAGDDWNWTGDNDKIATLPYGEIKVTQKYVAAVCTNYWTNNTYTSTAKPTAVTFTEGEGLVTIDLRLRKEEVIWFGAECVFAEITPTEAAEAITEDTIVSGTFQMHYAPWGKACEVPFKILLKPDDGDNRPTVPFKDMSNQASEAVMQMISGAESIPYVHEVISADKIYRGLFLRKEMLNYIPCVTDGIKCPTVLGYTAKDLKIKVTKNADLAEFSVEIARYDGDAWGDCFYVTLKPTAKAKTVDPKTYVGGVFYFEKNGHKTREIPFRFFFEEAGSVPQFTKYVMLEEMTDQAYNAFTTVRVGGNMTPVHATLQYGEDYRGRLMREAMLPYISCEKENTYCYMLKQYGNEDLVIDVQTNAHLIKLRTELAAHDGPAWGNCFYLYATLTEAAKDVAPGTAITGEIYFQRDGHKTRAIPFVFSVKEENTVLTEPYEYPWTADMEMILMGDFAEQVNDYIIATRNGTRLEPVTFVFQPGFKYVGNVMTTAMIPFVLCETDGIYCPETPNFSVDNLVANFTQNGDLIKDIRFEVADYMGWGVDCIYMFVTFNEKAMQAERGTLIDCLLSFQCNGHKTQDIALKMYLFENPDRDKEDGGTRVVEDEEEAPTVPTPEQQKPQPVAQDNSLVLILALAVAALLLILILLILLLLLKKKRAAEAGQ